MLAAKRAAAISIQARLASEYRESVVVQAMGTLVSGIETSFDLGRLEEVSALLAVMGTVHSLTAEVTPLSLCFRGLRGRNRISLFTIRAGVHASS